MPTKRLFTIYVNRSSDFVGYSAERNVFTVKLTVAVLEVVHTRIINAVGAVYDRPSTALFGSRAAPYVVQVSALSRSWPSSLFPDPRVLLRQADLGLHAAT